VLKKAPPPPSAANRPNTIFGTKAAATTDGYIFLIQAGGKFGMPCPTKTFFAASVLTVPFDDTTHHVAVVVDGTAGVVTFYLDGVPEALPFGSSFSILYTTPVISVGGWPPGTTPDLEGVLDDLAFYKTPLTAERLNAHRMAAAQ
jgi:hypothetical protein